MITYIYWTVVFSIIIASVVYFGGILEKWKLGFTTALLVFFIGFGAYYFHFQQIFVKHYGGVMAITIPDDELHLAATWKDDNLWIENYNPQTNTCHFREYSRGNLLQGQVTIKNCNPVLRQP